MENEIFWVIQFDNGSFNCSPGNRYETIELGEATKYHSREAAYDAARTLTGVSSYPHFEKNALGIIITESMYAAAIPSFCGMGTTVERHLGALGCWGLMSKLRAGKLPNCSGCPENTSLSKHEVDAIWANLRALSNDSQI